MKINDILLESFSDAKRIFSQDEDKDTVTKYLDTFKDLTKRNIIKGQEKDIGKWINAGWDEFKSFVDSKKGEKSKSALKKDKKSGAIVVHEDAEKMVVIPVTEDASCFYGRQTKWCTAATEGENQFKKYFPNGANMYYILMSDGSKYAATHFTKEIEIAGTINFANEVEFRNDRDKLVNPEVAGITEETIRQWSSEYKNQIKAAREQYHINIADKMWESDDAMELARYLVDNKIRHKKYEDLIASDANASIWYAGDVLKGPFPDGEDVISKDTSAAEFYARVVIKKPFPEGESAIARGADESVSYAQEVLKGPFREGEDAIATDAYTSSYYAIKVLDGPFPKGEAIIATDLSEALKYVKMLRDKGFEEQAKQFGKLVKEHHEKTIDIRTTNGDLE